LHIVSLKTENQFKLCNMYLGMGHFSSLAH